MKDLIYEFFKYSKTNQNFFTLPDEKNGSGYQEIYSVSEIREIDPRKIILIKSGERSAVKDHVRLMDAGLEVLHPAVLLDLLVSGRMPEDWRGKHIDFLGAWFCATGNWKNCNNPMTISTFWSDYHWNICYGPLLYFRESRFTAVTLR